MKTIDPNRLTIRPTMFYDDLWLFKITGDPDATRYMGFKTHKTVDEARTMLRIYDESPTTFLAICDKDEPGQLLGVLGYEVVGHQATMTMKLNLHDRRVRGAARLVCKPFLAALLQQPKIYRVWSYIHVDNKVSQNLTKKCGAERESYAPRFARFPNISDEPQGCFIYSAVK